MAMTTIEEFQNYLLQNGDKGNAENLNRAPIQLKTELTEHEILLNILQGNNPAEYVPGQVYQVGAYVTKDEQVWKCLTITTTAPYVDNTAWKLIELYASGVSTGSNTDIVGVDLQKVDYIASENQTFFAFFEAQFVTKVNVFVDGILLGDDEYTMGTSGVTLDNPLNAKQRVTIVYGNTVPTNTNLITKTYEVIATEGQTEFNVRYNPGFENIFVEGMKLTSDEYTVEATGSIIVLKEPLSEGAVFGIQSFGVLIDESLVTNNRFLSMSTGVIDLGQADVFELSLTESASLSIINVPGNQDVVSFTLEVSHAGDFALSWFDGIIWDSGISPNLSSGKDILGFYTTDGGTIWKGFVLGKDLK